MKMNPYLAFGGNCEEALNAYARILGGKVRAVMKFSDAPEGMPIEPSWKNKVMHAELEFDGNVLMATDAPPQYSEGPMKGMSVSLHIDNVPKAETIFKALSDGGQVKMPFEETFWAARFGMVVDRFGTPWMLNCDKPS